MFVFRQIKNLQEHLHSLPRENTIGFVPTMGALHEGHLSLIEIAKQHCDCVVVSIFVNPTQFDKPEDLQRYPKTLSNDIELLKSSSCAVVFCPDAEEVYDGLVQRDQFSFAGLDLQMEGKFRPGHFEGVATVVNRLFAIVKPNKAFFGEKDFQQLQIIKKMVSTLNLPIDIVGCPIVRELDGLAMSSRNVLLSDAQRSKASLIYKTLSQVAVMSATTSVKELYSFVQNVFKEEALFQLEYFQIVDESTLNEIDRIESSVSNRAFIAVFAGNVRLIDNVKI